MENMTIAVRVFFLFFLILPFIRCYPLLAAETVYLTPQQALEIAFPDSTSLTPRTITLSADLKKKIERRIGVTMPEDRFTIYTSRIVTKPDGYALILDEIGKHLPITFMVAFTPQKQVKSVQVLVYRERVGSNVRQPNFLKQFISKSSQDSLSVGNDINGITGATMSSWAISAGVKKAAVIVEELDNPL